MAGFVAATKQEDNRCIVDGVVSTEPRADKETQIKQTTKVFVVPEITHLNMIKTFNYPGPASHIFDDDGRLLSIQEMSADAKASLAGLETVMVGTGDQVDYIKKIKTYDKLKALGDLATNTLVFSKRTMNRGNSP